MIDRTLLREDPERVKTAIERKGTSLDLDHILEVYQRWRAAKSKGDDLRHERNTVSKRIGELKREGKEEAAQEAIDRSNELKSELESVEAEAQTLEEELHAGLLRIPQIPHESVPIGTDETENVERRREGFDDIRSLPESVIPHYDLAEELGVIDFERGAKVSGGGFQFLQGDGARLESALITFMMDLHRENGYIDVFPPLAVNSASMRGTGQFPKFVEDAYRIGGANDEPYDDDDLWLLPTAEVPLTNLHREEILLDEALPLKYQAFSPNFRREAGEHGTETRGYVRVHQFNKVELVNFVRPEDSYERFDELLAEAEMVLQRLGLPYRVLEMCTGDLGFSQAKKYDLEVWAPGDDMPDGPDRGGRWLEVSSISNFEAFQARRAGIQYRPKRHESAEYVHTLNGSGVALPRVVVAILEYYQNDDGSVTIPEPLRPYMDGRERIEPCESVSERVLGESED